MRFLSCFTVSLRWIILVAAFLTALSAKSQMPLNLPGPCTLWKVEGNLHLIQENNSIPTELRLTQLANNKFKGIASFSMQLGSIEGTVSANTFEATVKWSNNKAIGIYFGTIGSNGFITGTTHDKLSRAIELVSFHSTDPLVCLARAKNAPPAKPPVAPGVAGHQPTAPSLAGLNKGIVAPVAKPPAQVSRVKSNPADPKPSICDAAQSARARNSPAAPGLERQCNALLTNPDQASQAGQSNQNNSSAFNPQNQQSPSNQQNPFSQNSNGYYQDNGYNQSNGGYQYNQGRAPVNEVQIPKSALSR
jgi:hypothetical protein